jgi:hypothetical protein
MKCLLLCLTLVFWSSSLAQQTAEWRPSIAEDNKAATWEQTAAFIVGSLGQSAHAEERCVLHTPIPSKFDNVLGIKLSEEVLLMQGGAALILAVDRGSFAGQIGLRSGMQIIEVRIHRIVPKETIGIPGFLKEAMPGDDLEFRIRYGGEEVSIRGKLTKESARIPQPLVITLFANRVDPLSIAVHGNFVRLSGTNNQSIAETDDKEPVSGTLRLQVSDDEVAKRAARAMMHAALLGGGTKSVSPF